MKEGFFLDKHFIILWEFDVFCWSESILEWSFKLISELGLDNDLRSVVDRSRGSRISSFSLLRMQHGRRPVHQVRVFHSGQRTISRRTSWVFANLPSFCIFIKFLCHAPLVFKFFFVDGLRDFIDLGLKLMEVATGFLVSVLHSQLAVWGLKALFCFIFKEISLDFWAESRLVEGWRLFSKLLYDFFVCFLSYQLRLLIFLKLFFFGFL